MICHISYLRLWSGGCTPFTLEPRLRGISPSHLTIRQWLTPSELLDLGLDRDNVNPENFGLMTPLTDRLGAAAHTLYSTNGFLVIRGLEAPKYSADDNTTIYLGLSSYIADQRGLQDKKGNVLSMSH